MVLLEVREQDDKVRRVERIKWKEL